MTNSSSYAIKEDYLVLWRERRRRQKSSCWSNHTLCDISSGLSSGVFSGWDCARMIVSPSARHLPSRHRRHRRQNAKEGLQSHFFCNEARGPSQSPRQAVFRGKTVVDGEEMRKKLPFIPQIKLPRFVSPPASSRMLASWASRRPHF